MPDKNKRPFSHVQDEKPPSIGCLRARLAAWIEGGYHRLPSELWKSSRIPSGPRQATRFLTWDNPASKVHESDMSKGLRLLVIAEADVECQLHPPAHLEKARPTRTPIIWEG